MKYGPASPANGRLQIKQRSTVAISVRGGRSVGSINRAAIDSAAAATDPWAMQNKSANGNKGDNVDRHDSKTVVSGNVLQSEACFLLFAQQKRLQRGATKIREERENNLHNTERPALVKAELRNVGQSRIRVPPVHKQQPLQALKVANREI